MGGKLKAVCLMLLIFGLGMISGIAWQMHTSRHKSSWEDRSKRRIARLKKELHLKPWQEEALKDIIQDARERVRDIRDGTKLDMTQVRQDSLETVRQMLTPEQQKQFEKMRKHKGA